MVVKEKPSLSRAHGKKDEEIMKYAMTEMYEKEGKEEREWSLVEALHLALLIHFSLSITVMYAND